MIHAQVRLKVFNQVSTDDFEQLINALRQSDSRYQSNLSQLDCSQYNCFISETADSGYALSKKQNNHGERELANVFSTVTGTGYHSVSDALLKEKLLWLSCFSGLLKFYRKSGFIVTQTEPNWTVGGPDVLFMSSNPLRAPK